MSNFAPTLNPADTRAPYADGPAGHAQSLQMIAKKIREGRVSRAVLGWAGNVLHFAGIDGRGMGPVTRKQAQAILDAYRDQTVYTADPIGSELIQSAEATLCLAKDLCVRRADCDDSCVAVGSALLGIGIPTMVVKEDYPSQNGKTPQSHVLLYSRDEQGEWFSIDPSTRSAVGVVTAPRNTTRTWVNPIEDAPVEIVGIGRQFSETVEIVGIGAPPTIPGTWTNVADNSVKAGLRYAVGVVVNPDWNLDDVTSFFSKDWLVEQLGQRTEFPTINAWIMIGLARKTQTLNDTSDAHYSAVLQESAPPVEPVPATNPLATQTAPVPTPSVGIGDVLMWGVGIAAVGGLGYGAYEWNKKHKKRLRR